jgi:hypothetical protein
VWESDTAGNNDAMGQIYNADGSKLGGEMTIAGPQIGHGSFLYNWIQQRPVAACTGDGFNRNGTTPSSGIYQSEFKVGRDGTNDETEPAIRGLHEKPRLPGELDVACGCRHATANESHLAIAV